MQEAEAIEIIFKYSSLITSLPMICREPVKSMTTTMASNAKTTVTITVYAINKKRMEVDLDSYPVMSS